MKLKMIEHRLSVSVLENVDDKYNYYDRLTGVNNKNVRTERKTPRNMHLRCTGLSSRLVLQKGKFFPDSVQGITNK